MIRTRFFAFTGLFLFVALACASCAGYSGGQIYSSAAWEHSGGSAGKVLLIVTGEQEPGQDNDAMVKRHAAAVTRAAVEALNKLPGTSVINVGQLPALWVADMGDAQAVAQAKAKGADSVCVLTMGEYQGRFAIMVPPAWNLETNILYSLRLIDVKSGDLLAHAVIHRANGGDFAVLPFDDLQQGMAKSLNRALRHPPVAANPAPATPPATAELHDSPPHGSALSG